MIDVKDSEQIFPVGRNLKNTYRSYYIDYVNLMVWSKQMLSSIEGHQ